MYGVQGYFEMLLIYTNLEFWKELVVVVEQTCNILAEIP